MNPVHTRFSRHSMNEDQTPLFEDAESFSQQQEGHPGRQVEAENRHLAAGCGRNIGRPVARSGRGCDSSFVRNGRRANPRHQCRAPLGPMARLGSLRYPCPILGVRSCSVDRDTPQTIGCTRASPGSGDPSCRMINTAPSMATDDVVSIAGMKNSWHASKLCTSRRGTWGQPQTAHDGEQIKNRGCGQDG